ncbi:MAG: orotidine-5'-phosphate decarboxylase [Sphingobacteriales bacterium]|nr:MAG: orotidine-5'-phosphate decarboxylase [Sphingobacteriales bacterium]
MNNRNLILRLYDINAVQFGQFQLRTGIMSPFYLDFRKIVSYPSLMRVICAKLSHLLEDIAFDYLCGVPYAALSFATGVAITHDAPLVVKRKDRKEHGTKKIVEGDFKTGATCVVVEDIVTSGISILETIEALENEGLVVQHAIAIVDRKQGGTDILARMGYTVHTLFNIQEIFDVLLQAGKIDKDAYESSLNFVKENVTTDLPVKKEIPRKSISYKKRIELCRLPVSKRLLQIAESKQSNLILSADVDTAEELINIARQTGPHICMLKTHVDILPDFTQATINELKQIAKEHDFLLFEDRKFADIGNTVQKQFAAGLFNLPLWADVLTVHVVAGGSSIIALKETGLMEDKGLVIIAQMSTADTLTDENYIQKATKIGEANKDIVIGYVAQQPISTDAGLLQFTPGVHLAAKDDHLGQTYNSPRVAFTQRGADFIIVGRGIYKHTNPEQAAVLYKEAGWQAYLQQIAE